MEIIGERYPKTVCSVAHADNNRENAIRLSAYLQWEAEGCPGDSAWDYWLDAEEAFDYPVDQPLRKLKATWRLMTDDELKAAGER
jgi:hypothetical protein